MNSKRLFSCLCIVTMLLAMLLCNYIIKGKVIYEFTHNNQKGTKVMAVTPRQIVGLDNYNLTPMAKMANAPAGIATSTVDGYSVSAAQQAAQRATQQAAAAKQAAANPLLASLSSLDQILNNRNAQTQDEYNRALTGYNEQDALDRQAYTKNVTQNESTLTGNNQRALLNAANAGSGLKGVLSSLGGLAGSGGDVVSRLVGLAANQDTGAARETFDVNADNLNASWGQAERQQRQRREDADATLRNNRQNNEAGVLSSKQSIFEQLANLYGGDTNEGRSYASQASSLAAPIAATSRAAVAPYQAASSSFSPDALKNYLAGTQNLQVDTAGGGGEASVPVNSPLFGTKRKDQLSGVA